MGPIAARSFPGRRVVRADERAKRMNDYGRRARGYVFGIFLPHTGQAMTATYPERTISHWLEFLERAEKWVPGRYKRVIAILDNLSAHHAQDVLLFILEHPRWEFLFQPARAAYLNLIEPWWKVLRSLALTGRRFEDWQDVTIAILSATRYWNKHGHPFRWGRRRKRARRSLTDPRTPGLRLTA
jgi:hypothetical protein